MTGAELAPSDDEAEQSILGALMLAGGLGPESSRATLDAVLARGLTAEHFYARQRRGYTFEAIVAVVDRGEPAEPLLVEKELRARGRLDDVGGPIRLRELAACATATGNAPHYAGLVVAAARDRELLAGLRGAEAAVLNGGFSAEDRDDLRERLRESTVLPGLSRFPGLTFGEARAAEVPPTRDLVEDVVDLGTVGLIAGLPFSRKSWLAQELAHKVAAGHGEILGRFPIITGGPVIYVWQDDSTAKELERIQLYASRHNYPDSLPLRFLLNEGIRLPDDLPALRALVEHDGAVLIAIDSLYNCLAPTVSLKDEDVALVLAAVKHDLCDPTGCTVAIVDHSPWPSEQNRGQRRAYGSVFKTAAVRWAIHLEADAKDDRRLHVEASGNNVAGFRRTPAVWNDDTFEIRLLDVQRVDEEELDERVREYLAGVGWSSTKTVTENVTGRAQNVRESLRRLENAGTITSASSRDLGRPGSGNYWNLRNEAGFQVVPLPGTTPDDPTAGYVTNTEGRPVVPPPKGGRPSVGPPSSEPSAGLLDELAEGSEDAGRAARLAVIKNVRDPEADAETFPDLPTEACAPRPPLDGEGAEHPDPWRASADSAWRCPSDGLAGLGAEAGAELPGGELGDATVDALADVAEIEDDGGAREDCTWGVLDRSRLSAEQARHCGCQGCMERAAALLDAESPS